MSRLRDPENGVSGGSQAPPDARTLSPACGHPTEDGPCKVPILLMDGKCYRHSIHVTDAQEREARRLGGRRATGRADGDDDVAPVRLQTRADVSKARAEIYALLRARPPRISAPTGAACLMALRDADNARDKAEQRELDRRGRRPQQHVLHVTVEPWVRALAGRAGTVSTAKRVGPGPPSAPDR